MKKTARAPARNQASIWTQLLIPLAALVRGDLLALVHQLGLQAVGAMLETELQTARPISTYPSRLNEWTPLRLS